MEAAIGLAKAHEAFVLLGTCVQTEVNQVVDAGLPCTDAEVFVTVFQVESKVGGGLELVLPTEMVGVVACLKPVGGLSPDFNIEGDGALVSLVRSDVLPPLPFQVEVANLVA